MVEQPTPQHSSRYRHDNINMVINSMDPLEITETDSRKGSEIPKTNEKRDERKARTAANGAEKTETRKQKETEAKADRTAHGGKKGPNRLGQVTKSPI